MVTRPQFDALGQTIDADVTAIESKVNNQAAQIAALQQQVADLEAQLASSMTAQEEDDTYAQFQAIQIRTAALAA